MTRLGPFSRNFGQNANNGDESVRSRGWFVRAGISFVVVAFIAAVVVALGDRPRVVGPIPDRLADSTFWRMMTDMSEPDGYFRSDNFVSNEAAFQYVIPDLLKRGASGGVYLGVGPDQNFTYIAAFRPRIAFIVDIRRQNAMQHLMYKALIELAQDRADFLSMLFSRRRPAGLDADSSPAELMAAYAGVPADGDWRDTVMERVAVHLRETNGFPITDEDFASIEYVHGAFYEGGPLLTYTMGRPGNGTGFGSRAGNWPPSRGGAMPTYAWLMQETDGRGAERSYLATEHDFRTLQDLQRRNLIVPLVGDFAGNKTLREVGRWLRQRGAVVSVFYTSNVEQYLFQQGADWERFYDNVRTLPIDSTSTFIRSVSNRMAARAQNPNSRMVQLTLPIAELLAAYHDRQVSQYRDVVEMSR